jgi:two-component system LytT family response regulator
MKLTAVLVEDEYKVREVFKNLLQHYCKEIEVLGEAENITDAYDLILITKPQIVFLDIEMPNGLGFDLLKKFQKPPFEVIFVTSYGHFAIKAIKFSALDYLLKPVMINDLLDMVTRVKEKFENKNQQGYYNVLLENLDINNQQKKLVVSTKNKTECVLLNDIMFLEGDGNYTNIQLSDNKICVAKTLKDYEDLLCNSESSFMRIHKTHIVNTNFVLSINHGETNTIVLKNDFTLEVSRRKKQELIEKLNAL